VYITAHSVEGWLENRRKEEIGYDLRLRMKVLQVGKLILEEH
jgi:hypothetical protein